MSQGALIGIILLFLVINTGVIWYFSRRKEEKTDDTGLTFLQNQLNDLHRVVDEKIGESSRLMRDSVQNQFSESQKLIKEITKEITEVKETNKQVFGITEQLQNLEKVLKNQKQRGNLGEAGLELILSNILPPTAYTLQYGFPVGETVDAVIQTKEGLIPVDAKFSLDNYNRIVNEEDPDKKAAYEKDFKNDLKKRIDETAKYIRPKDGTLPFALMYIPAEGIYYDLLVNEVGAVKVNTRNLIDYAYQDKKVVIVSPTTFVAYLNTILQGFKAFQIEKSAQAIAKQVEGLTRHLKAYEEYHQKLGNSLSTTVNHFNRTQKEFKKIDKDVLRITGEGVDVGETLLENPTKE